MGIFNFRKSMKKIIVIEDKKEVKYFTCETCDIKFKSDEWADGWLAAEDVCPKCWDNKCPEIYKP